MKMNFQRADQPECCVPSKEASLAEILYCTYNAGGHKDRAGLNYMGAPCPTWKELNDSASHSDSIKNVILKWEAVAEAAHGILYGISKPS